MDAGASAPGRSATGPEAARAGCPEDANTYLWVGTAGTVTTLARMHLELKEYEPERVNGSVLKKAWLEQLCTRLAHMAIAQRCKLPGLERGREDIILAGGLVTLELMDTFDFAQFTVSDAGLLEGLILDLCSGLG